MCGAQLASKAGPLPGNGKKREGKLKVGTSAPTPQVSCLEGVEAAELGVRHTEVGQKAKGESAHSTAVP